MKKLTIFLFFVSLIVVPIVYAGKSKVYAGKTKEATCVINASEWARLAGEPIHAEVMIDIQGLKPVYDQFGLVTDAGYFGPSYIVFKLPSFKSPVLFGKLRIQVKSAEGPFLPDDPEYIPEFPFLLYDVTDISLLLQPLWDITEWQETKDDLMSGRNYGEFAVHTSPTDDGKIIEIPLSYDAIYDANEAAGGMFAIGLGPGEVNWSMENEAIYFLMPDEGGIAQLEFTLLTTFGKHHGKNPCMRSHNKHRDDD